MGAAATLLAKIDAAITDLIDGKIASYSISGRTFTYLTLDQLRQLRAEVAIRAGKEAGTRRRFIAIKPGGAF
ncbi:MAG: hypothetical protein AB7F40_12255 [Victivallaceae bacterium]